MTSCRKHFETCHDTLLHVYVVAKGQLISKGLFSVFNSPKKRMKTFDLICHSTEGRIFSFFLEEFRIPTSPFEIT
jgi:hypothetical protein